MAFPSVGGSKSQLASSLSEVMALVRTVKNSTQSMRDQSAAGPVTVRGVVLMMDDLQIHDDRLSVLSAVSGLAQYAKDQFNTPEFDIATEFATMRAAITTVITWVDDNVPKAPGNRWLELEEIVSGRLIERTLTTAQTAGLRTELDALLATID